MRLQYLFAAGILALSACNSKESDENLEPGVVDVVGAIENPEELKVSMLGSKIRFVPLETSDSALLTDSWNAAFSDDKIIIGNAPKISFGGDRGNRAMVFDLNTGKYIRSIGNQGEGPGEYSSPVPVVSNDGSRLFFNAGNLQGWETYDIDGKYLGKILPDLDIYDYKMIAVEDTVVFLNHYNRERQDRKMVFDEYSLGGNLLDSIVMFEGHKSTPKYLQLSGNTSIAVHDTPLRGSILEFINDDRSYIPQSDLEWHVGNELHMKESYCDTIFRLANDIGDRVSLIFNTGSHRFPVEKVNQDMIGEDNIFITDVVETPTKVVFAFCHGWIGDDNHKEYIGIYDRKTKKTHVSLAENGIADDLTGFMPIKPTMVTSNGDLAAYLTMDEIEMWFDENPDVERPAWLDGVEEDGNPILVIISD